MKITGVLVNMLVQLSPKVYGPFVVTEHGKKVLYVRLLRALYGQLEAALLWYRKLRSDLEEQGFKFNPYDPCVANRKINGGQHTIRFHVDDVMSSHRKPKVNTDFYHWLNQKYGTYGDVKCTRGTLHDYLGMKFDFSTPGQVHVNMKQYICELVDDFSEKISGTKEFPADEKLFSPSEGPSLNRARAEEFHHVVAKGLFVCKRA
jgi:hypothetical protein